MSGSALTVSTTFIGVCCVLAAVGRYVVGRTVKSTLLKELMNEAIASAELCACCFELIIGKKVKTDHHQFSICYFTATFS